MLIMLIMLIGKLILHPACSGRMLILIPAPHAHAHADAELMPSTGAHHLAATYLNPLALKE
jgi:hypothetical protein